jgi:hypothetical protein
VTVAQVANVTAAFTEAGIMVHAYLMYGFPTQTAQETIDSLEMVRQMLEQGIVQSGFWHQFAMTAHSPVGLNPAAFGVLEVGPKFGGFADNDRFHDDPEGADHELFAEGLRKSLFNYMRGTGFDVPLRKWFDHKVPRTRMAPDYIAQCLEADPEPPRSNAFLVWLGNVPRMQVAEDGMAELEFVDLKEEYILEFSLPMAAWLHELLPRLLPGEPPVLFTDVKAGFVEADFEDYKDWDAFWESEIAEKLRESGLLVI